jgi:RNA polymerase sigma-70 factor (ECF subfamily)
MGLRAEGLGADRHHGFLTSNLGYPNEQAHAGWRPRSVTRRLHLSGLFAPYPGVLQSGPVSLERDEELESLYVEHAERLWRALFAYSGDREVASDAVAEAFAQCLARRAAVRAPGRWIWRAAFRIAAGELKERRMWAGGAQEGRYEMDEGTGGLVEALGSLPPRQRAALVLHYYAGYKAREIAAIVGSSAATVRVHLSQGRKRLRRVLEAEDD